MNLSRVGRASAGRYDIGGSTVLKKGEGRVASMMRRMAASRSFAMSMPLFATMTTRDAPLSLSSCAKIKSVGPTPSIRTSTPTGAFSLSSP